MYTGIRVFAGNANKELAEKICSHLEIDLGESEVSTFSDGEIKVNIKELVRGFDVFIIQPTTPPEVNKHIMELLIMIDALKRASAGRITAVMPYYGYARQDRKAKARDPISAKLIADLLTTAGADRVLTMDLHAAQIQGYFDMPVDHLVGNTILANHIKDNHSDMIDDVVVVSPDVGSVARARKFADKLEAPIAIIDKRRPKENVSEVMNVIGEIKDKNLIIIDDMIDTAGTITNGADALKEMGAKRIFAACSHGIFSGPAIERLEKSSIEKVITLNSIDQSRNADLSKLEVVDASKTLANAISRIHLNMSISAIFDNYMI